MAEEAEAEAPISNGGQKIGKMKLAAAPTASGASATSIDQKRKQHLANSLQFF